MRESRLLPNLLKHATHQQQQQQHQPYASCLSRQKKGDNEEKNSNAM